MKKRIGISFTRTNFDQYWKWIGPAELGEMAELVELSFVDNNWEDVISCDGYILTGGVDVEPSHYGKNSFYPHCPERFQKDRDIFEEKIYRFAQDRKLPLLGICRGMQLINVILGGKLIQDLGEANPQHRKILHDLEHEVYVKTGSLLHELTGSLNGMVNSAHHQAIDPFALGENLQVNARSADNIIEGIEFQHKDAKPFMIGLQWHPERMKERELNPFSQLVKERFLKETMHNLLIQA